MKTHFTVGIAGHVDHGKTTLVKALTGIDTDRMREEKKRGVSIESGVAAWSPSPLYVAALMDVPGHTDYFINTIRGLSTVDLAILVIAADDGVMPQTREHLEALSFFGASGGLVVLSKTDLVDEEVLELAEMEICDLVTGTFLENKPVIRFAPGGVGCKTEIAEILTREIENRSHTCSGNRFRLWVDQVRSVNGFGTVVSGTVRSGEIHQNDSIFLQPSGIRTRVRFIESHGQPVASGQRGQRIGINLHKIPLENVKRGMLITSGEGQIAPGYILNGEIRYLRKNTIPLQSRIRVRLYTGTLSVNARFVLMGQEEILPGEEGLVQFRLESPSVIDPGDRFVISLLNRRSVIGGGRFLETSEEKYTKSRSERILSGVRALRANDIRSYALYATRYCSARYRSASPGELATRSVFSETELALELNRGIDTGLYLRGVNDGVFDPSEYRQLSHHVVEIVTSILKEEPSKASVNKTEIIDRLRTEPEPELMTAILSDLIADEKLIRSSSGYSIRTHIRTLPKERQALADEVLKFAEDSGLVPFSAKRFVREVEGYQNAVKAAQMLHFLYAENRLIRLTNKRFLSIGAMEKIREIVKKHILETGRLTIGDSRGLLGYGRTMAVPVFEFLDKEGLTVRIGDHRVLKYK